MGSSGDAEYDVELIEVEELVTVRARAGGDWTETTTDDAADDDEDSKLKAEEET